MQHAPLATTATKYLAALDAWCNTDDVDGCLALGQLLQQSPALPQDKARAHRAFLRGCQLGDAINCLNASGNALEGGDETATLRAGLTTACTAGDGRSCAVQGAFALGLDHDQDAYTRLTNRSADLLEKSCLDAMKFPDCVLAAQVMVSPPVKPDRARITRVLHHGCDHNDGESCYTAGNLSDLPHDERNALYARACTLQRATPCYVLAVEAEDKAAFQRALALAIADCNLGNEDSCKVVASSLVTDYLSPAQVVEVEDLSQRACDRSMSDICYQLAQALARGPEARRDPARTAALQDTACRSGYTPACLAK